MVATIWVPLYAWNLSFPKLEEAYRTAKRIYEDEGGAGLTNKQKLLIEFEPDVKAILKLNTAKDGIWKLQSAKNKITVAKDMTAQEKRKSIDRINAKNYHALSGRATEIGLLPRCDRQHGRKK